MPVIERDPPADFHALYDTGARAALGVAAAATTAGRQPNTSGHERLGKVSPLPIVNYDEVTGVPVQLVTTPTAGAAGARTAGTVEAAALNWVKTWLDVWNLKPEDADSISVVAASSAGIPTVRLIQRIGGKEIFNSDVTVSLTPSNEVIGCTGQFFAGAASATAAARAGTLASEEQVIAMAASDLTGMEYDKALFSPDGSPPDDGGYRFYKFTPPADTTLPPFERPVRVKDVMFPRGDQTFVAGYYVELWIKGLPPFSYVLDTDGTPDLLFRKNLSSMLKFKYRVHNTNDAVLRPEDGPAPGTPHPTGIPDGFQAPTIPEKLIEVDSLLPNRPWLPNGATTTSGNNCIAYADLVGGDGLSTGDILGKITAPGEFDYKYDHSKGADVPNNLQASLVGMFFHVNWLHDRWYEAGFDEASGNAQKDNFGLGGMGNDPILAEGNDFSGHDNANMDTPPDGASPRMQMFLFKGPQPANPSRTSNHEALITFHEMGHYITNRLVGNGGGLFNTQGRAMSEGWGDFFAICMTSQATDDFKKGVFAVGGWTDLSPSFKQNYYFSIRRYPYSADMAKSPLTFKHISRGVLLPVGPPRRPGQSSPNEEFHNAGEIWCAMLWEVFVNLVAKHGHAKAEKQMLLYVVNGLKLTPSRPTFTQARDGIITAVTSLEPGDLPEVWTGFAKRGIGDGAVSPPSNSVPLTGVVESFKIPESLTPGRAILFDLGDTLEHNNILLPGAMDALNAIRNLRDSAGRPLAMGLISDFDMPASPADIPTLRQKYVAIVDTLGIRPFFEPVATGVTLSTDVGVFKPNPAVFRTALDKIKPGLPFKNALFITENRAHVDAAAALGMKAVHFKGPGQATGTISKLSALVPIVQAFIAPAVTPVITPSGPPAGAGVPTAHLGDQVFRFGLAPSGAAARTAFAAATARAADDPRDHIHLVVQKGQPFQKAHPEVPILVNRGRYLVVALDPAIASKLDGKDNHFSIRPLEDGHVAFETRPRDAARPAGEQWVRELVRSVCRKAYEEVLVQLTSFPTRHSTSPEYLQAAAAMATRLKALGYDVQTQAITVGGKASQNVIAERKGGATGNRGVVLVTAHLDSVNHDAGGSPQAPAPGADDNGSGSAGVLEIARVLRAHPASEDVRFILFGGEEQGLFGSKQYVKSLSKDERKRIRAVVNMDMIGCLNQSPMSVLVEGAALSKPIIKKLGEAAATYTNLVVETSLNPFASDHVSFIEADIPAVLTIEGADQANPNDHTGQDVIGKINYGIALEILRMNVAFVAQSLGRIHAAEPASRIEKSVEAV